MPTRLLPEDNNNNNNNNNDGINQERNQNQNGDLLNQNHINDDDEDDDDLFDDNVWNNISNNNGIRIEQNGIENNDEDDDDGDNVINNEYVLINQDENINDNNRLRNYRHEYRIEWNDLPSTVNNDENNEINDEQNNNNNSNNNDDDDDDDDKLDVDTIRNLMANFQLPNVNYPDWAHIISETEWQQHLRQRLNNRQR